MCSHSKHWVALGTLKALPVEVVIGAAESGCESGDRGFLVSSICSVTILGLRCVRSPCQRAAELGLDA